MSFSASADTALLCSRQAGELLRPCLAELARGRGEQSPLRARFVPAQTPALPTAAGGCQAQLCLPLSIRGCQVPQKRACPASGRHCPAP